MKKSLPILIMFIPIFIFFARLFYPESSLFMIPDFGESDVLHLNLPLKHLLSSSLKSGEWPLWTTYLSSGFPILAEGQIGTFYLPNLLFFKYLPTITAYNLNLILAFFLSSIGFFLFAKSIGLSSLTAIFTAVVFTFSGFLTVHLNHFNLLQAASLLPLIFWASYRLCYKHKLPNLVLFSFLLTEQIFTGHFYIVFITLVGIFIFFLINRYKIKFLFLGCFFAFFLSAIQLFPTIELQQKSGRAGGMSFNTVTSYPYPPKHLLAFINPYIFGSPATGTYPPFSDDWGIFWENTAYIGILPFLFALASFIYIKEKWVKTGFVILSISLLLVLGKYSPFYFVFSIPPFNFFRVPSKFLLLTTFSLSLLSGCMMEKITKKLKSRLKVVFFTVIVFLLVFADEFYFSYNYPPLSPCKWWTEIPQTAKFIAQKDGRIVSIGTSKFWNEIFLKDGWKDIKPYVYLRNGLYPNYNALFAIPNIEINTGGLISKRTSLMMSLSQEIKIDEKQETASISATAANILSLQNTTHIISPYKIDNPIFPKETEVNIKTYKLKPFYIYKNTKSLPRAYIAYKSKLITTTGDFYRNLSDEKFLDEKMVLVEDKRLLISNKNEQAGMVKIINATQQNLNLETESSALGILVLTDSFYPDWKAYLDGRQTEIFSVNLNQRGIMLPPGQHKVNFVFESFSFFIGKIITIISGFIAFLSLFLYCVFFLRKFPGNKRPYRYR